MAGSKKGKGKGSGPEGVRLSRREARALRSSLSDSLAKMMLLQDKVKSEPGFEDGTLSGAEISHDAEKIFVGLGSAALAVGVPRSKTSKYMSLARKVHSQSAKEALAAVEVAFNEVLGLVTGAAGIDEEEIIDGAGSVYGGAVNTEGPVNDSNADSASTPDPEPAAKSAEPKPDPEPAAAPAEPPTPDPEPAKPKVEPPKPKKEPPTKKKADSPEPKKIPAKKGAEPAKSGGEPKGRKSRRDLGTILDDPGWEPVIEGKAPSEMTEEDKRKVFDALYDIYRDMIKGVEDALVRNPDMDLVSRLVDSALADVVKIYRDTQASEATLRSAAYDAHVSLTWNGKPRSVEDFVLEVNRAIGRQTNNLRYGLDVPGGYGGRYPQINIDELRRKREEHKASIDADASKDDDPKDGGEPKKDKKDEPTDDKKSKGDDGGRVGILRRRVKTDEAGDKKAASGSVVDRSVVVPDGDASSAPAPDTAPVDPKEAAPAASAEKKIDIGEPTDSPDVIKQKMLEFYRGRFTRRRFAEKPEGAVIAEGVGGGTKDVDGATIDYLTNEKKYSKSNQDRVVVSGDGLLMCAIDGMGGEGGPFDGNTAADVLAAHFAADTGYAAHDRSVEAHRELRSIAQDGGIDMRAGACYAAAELGVRNSKLMLDMSWVGDAKIVVRRSDGSVKFSSKEITLVGEMAERGMITADKALYHKERNRVSSYITGGAMPGGYVEAYGGFFNTVEDAIKELVDGGADKAAIDAIHEEAFREFIDDVDYELENGRESRELFEGDEVLIYTDGYGDNFVPEELVKVLDDNGSSLTFLDLEATARVSGRAHGKINADGYDREAAGVYEDGYKTKPKDDDRGIIRFKVRDLEALKKHVAEAEEARDKRLAAKEAAEDGGGDGVEDDADAEKRGLFRRLEGIDNQITAEVDRVRGDTHGRPESERVAVLARELSVVVGDIPDLLEDAGVSEKDVEWFAKRVKILDVSRGGRQRSAQNVVDDAERLVAQARKKLEELHGPVGDTDVSSSDAGDDVPDVDSSGEAAPGYTFNMIADEDAVDLRVFLRRVDRRKLATVLKNEGEAVRDKFMAAVRNEIGDLNVTANLLEAEMDKVSLVSVDGLDRLRGEMVSLMEDVIAEREPGGDEDEVGDEESEDNKEMSENGRRELMIGLAEIRLKIARLGKDFVNGQLQSRENMLAEAKKIFKNIHTMIDSLELDEESKDRIRAVISRKEARAEAATEPKDVMGVVDAMSDDMWSAIAAESGMEEAEWGLFIQAMMDAAIRIANGQPVPGAPPAASGGAGAAPAGVSPGAAGTAGGAGATGTGAAGTVAAVGAGAAAAGGAAAAASSYTGPSPKFSGFIDFLDLPNGIDYDPKALGAMIAQRVAVAGVNKAGQVVFDWLIDEPLAWAQNLFHSASFSWLPFGRKWTKADRDPLLEPFKSEKKGKAA